MSDHDDDKKNIDQDSTGDESDNQSLVEENTLPRPSRTYVVFFL